MNRGLSTPDPEGPKGSPGPDEAKTKTWTKREGAGAEPAFVQALVLIIVPKWRRGWTKAETKSWTKVEAAGAEHAFV